MLLIDVYDSIRIGFSRFLDIPLDNGELVSGAPFSRSVHTWSCRLWRFVQLKRVAANLTVIKSSDFGETTCSICSTSSAKWLEMRCRPNCCKRQQMDISTMFFKQAWVYNSPWMYKESLEYMIIFVNILKVLFERRNQLISTWTITPDNDRPTYIQSKNLIWWNINFKAYFHFRSCLGF